MQKLCDLGNITFCDYCGTLFADAELMNGKVICEVCFAKKRGISIIEARRQILQHMHTHS